MEMKKKMCIRNELVGEGREGWRKQENFQWLLWPFEAGQLESDAIRSKKAGGGNPDWEVRGRMESTAGNKML